MWNPMRFHFDDLEPSEDQERRRTLNRDNYRDTLRDTRNQILSSIISEIKDPIFSIIHTAPPLEKITPPRFKYFRGDSYQDNHINALQNAMALNRNNKA